MTAQQHTIQKRMAETIDQQLAGVSNSWILKMGPKKLRMVRSFVLSFIVEPGDRVIPYMDFPEPENTAPVDLSKPSDIEVIAERLAKVEDRLARLAVPADNFGSLLTRLDAVDARLDTQSELRVRSNRTLDQRIDKVAEIIGERVSGLEDQLMALAQKAGSVEAEHSEKLDQHSREIGRLLHLIFDEKPAPAFPTGGADTAEAATEAVLPVPQRGDRVRLEGAKSTGGTTLTGWYEVTGRYEQHFPGDHAQFQIGSVGSMGLYWVYDTDPGLKEVRHAADNI